MSMGPLGSVGAGAAGSPLAQVRAGDAERTKETTDRDRLRSADLKAEQSAGVGETDGEDHVTSERDADGRRPWEESPSVKDGAGEDDAPPRTAWPPDPAGQAGTLLDLSG